MTQPGGGQKRLQSIVNFQLVYLLLFPGEPPADVPSGTKAELRQRQRQ